MHLRHSEGIQEGLNALFSVSFPAVWSPFTSTPPSNFLSGFEGVKNQIVKQPPPPGFDPTPFTARCRMSLRTLKVHFIHCEAVYY